MTKLNILKRLENLIENAEKYGLDNFMAGLTPAVEILEEEEVEKLKKMFNIQQDLDERNIDKTLDAWVVAYQYFVLNHNRQRQDGGY